MTIPDVGRCLGSGEQPRAGTEELESRRGTGVCPACSGRFELEHGRLIAHETAPAGEREGLEASGHSAGETYEGPNPELDEHGTGEDEDQGI